MQRCCGWACLTAVCEDPEDTAGPCKSSLDQKPACLNVGTGYSFQGVLPAALQWGPSGVYVKGKFYSLARLQFVRRQQPKAAAGTGVQQPPAAKRAAPSAEPASS